ncbi:hypothetical protein [Streptomyces sp. H34-S4]|uniref:hypothetical protein n=1 Tax=Streptomyces sp. H34-S4 TaxID=2996463 RepID=UPI00226E567D|nr:hypothetical protein [Streptomyces sp. H34-S4]MCY0933825.1 hypothetical protein [Streptomyces sp. H34-S4]
MTSSEIALFISRSHGIVALVSGDNYRWARTALQLAGFEKDNDGNYVMPLLDTGRARQALAALGETSPACQSTVTTTDQRYIGDFAHDVSEHLPGQWTVRVENYSLPVWQGDLVGCLWATGPVLSDLQHLPVTAAAILQSETGAELAIAYNPRLSVYHVGMLVPNDVYLDERVTPPPGITVQPVAVPAARRISSSLLTDYHRAFYEMQLNHLGDDLAWAQEEFEPGMVQDPPRQDLAVAFARFSAIAPTILAALRTNDSHAFSAGEKAFLGHMEASFGQPGPGRGDAEAPRANPSLDLLGMWRTEGEDLVELARAASRSAPAQTTIDLVRAVAAPRALPAPPRRVGAALTRR